MADKEYEIPVKVVDRRWWANPEASSGGSKETASLKPTYVEELERQVAEKDRQAQEYVAKYRQAAAEFDEARLRLRREIAKDIERTRREVLSEMLEVLDNLDRALESGRQGSTADALLQGVEMVRRQFLAKLEGLGVRRIEVEGQSFDPSVHDAVTTVPAASPEQDGLVIGVIRHGYRIGEDVLRPASVAVAKAGAATG
ncbi:MAG TPA: nucleotide exchange factor GrpE [Vicinamibacterales bacterium]|nr:nucleotide exchange factor GrpE [Vicinamibacterales bacterium]